MSDEFFKKEDNREDATDIGDGQTSEEKVVEINTSIEEGVVEEVSTDNNSGTYRLSKPGRESEDREDRPMVNSSYSFWAEQVSGTGMEHTYEDYQQFKDNRGFDVSGSTYSTKDEKKEKKKSSILKKTGKLALTAVAFGLIAGITFIGFNGIYYKVNPGAAPIAMNYSSNGGFVIDANGKSELLSSTAVTDGKITQKTDVTEVVDETMPSIVQITTTYAAQSYDLFGQQYDQENQGGGSGIIVGKNDKELLIATNNHVVEGADPITVKFIDGTEAVAIIKGTDSVADLAVISIDLSKIDAKTLEAISIAKLGDSDSIKVGEMAIAIGNALGYGQSTTVGYISAKDREVQIDDKTMVLLQTDAAINPGNSGGALLNMNGEVIGINSVKYASDEVEGMGFAIPISRATPIIDELMNREVLTEDEKGYLGVYPQDVTEDVATMYNWPVGVFVREIIQGGSAETAGVVAGDIITKVNDTEITSSTQLKEKVNSYRIGTKITITIQRNTNGKFEEKTFDVTLTGAPKTDTNQ